MSPNKAPTERPNETDEPQRNGDIRRLQRGIQNLLFQAEQNHERFESELQALDENLNELNERVTLSRSGRDLGRAARQPSPESLRELKALRRQVTKLKATVAEVREAQTSAGRPRPAVSGGKEAQPEEAPRSEAEGRDPPATKPEARDEAVISVGGLPTAAAAPSRLGRRIAKRSTTKPDASEAAVISVPGLSKGAAAPSGLGRRIALASGIVAVAAIAGLLAGRWTADDSAPAAAPDQAAPAVADYGRTLTQEVDDLAGTRASELERLRDAQTPASQAAASEDLAAAHRSAASSLERASAPAELQSANESLVSALRQVADAYQQLAGGAAAGDSAVYEVGQAAVRSAEANLQQSLKAIGAVPG